MPMDSDLRRDCTAIQSIIGQITQLMAELGTTQVDLKAMERGYFLPDEDVQAKRFFVAYRNCRAALFDIIERRKAFEEETDKERRTAAFLLGFGSAMFLWRWSRILVGNYKDAPAIRDKLNEADLRHGLHEGSFDEMYRNLTRVENQEQLADAAAYYEDRHNELTAVFPTGPFAWLIEQIDKHYDELKRNPFEIWADRVARDLDVVPRRAAKPFAAVAYAIQSWIIDVCGSIWLGERPQLPAEHIRQLRDILEPGDLLIVRPEAKSSTVLIPGWWTHAAIYTGALEEMRATGVLEQSDASAIISRIAEAEGEEAFELIEALAAGVVVNRLEESMHVDHVVAFRPRLSPEQRLRALENCFGQYGKEYDFELDFARADRVVCTEVAYRTFDGIGPIRFNADFRFGRLTLSADDIVSQIIKDNVAGNPSFEFLALSTKDLQQDTHSFLTGDEGFAKLRKTLDL